MPPATDPPNVVPNVEDKRKPAPGVLPKSAQTWVVVGLTAVIMFTLWISGPAKGAQSAKKADSPRAEPVVGLSSTEIVARLEQERREQQAPFASADRSRNQRPEREDDFRRQFGVGSTRANRTRSGKTCAGANTRRGSLRAFPSAIARPRGAIPRGPRRIQHRNRQWTFRRSEFRISPVVWPAPRRARCSSPPLRRVPHSGTTCQTSIRRAEKITWSSRARFSKRCW